MELIKREIKELKYLADGSSNEEIAKKLNISRHTLKWHLETIYNKLGVENRIQAVIISAQNKFIDLKTIHIKCNYK